MVRPLSMQTGATAKYVPIVLGAISVATRLHLIIPITMGVTGVQQALGPTKKPTSRLSTLVQQPSGHPVFALHHPALTQPPTPLMPTALRLRMPLIRYRSFVLTTRLPQTL